MYCYVHFSFKIYPLELCFWEYTHVQSSEGSVASAYSCTEGKMQTHACVFSVIFVKFCHLAATKSAQFVSYSSKPMNRTPSTRMRSTYSPALSCAPQGPGATQLNKLHDLVSMCLRRPAVLLLKFLY